jgi:cell division protein FtsI (penicillin-binding protein 3)
MNLAASLSALFAPRTAPHLFGATRPNAPTRTDLQRWRMRFVLGTLFLCFGALVAKALYLQLWENDFLTREGNKRFIRHVPIPAHRGMLLDSNGEPLAISVPAETIAINPREAKATPQQIDQLAKLLGRNPQELHNMIADKGRSFVYLKRQAQQEDAQAVRALGIPGISFHQEYRRYYTAGQVMAQVLGVTNTDDHGQEGIESAYDAWLAGENGVQQAIKDGRGNLIEELDLVRLPKHGRDLKLSLNLQIQYLAWRELENAVREHDAKAASAVVLDAKTGEILAMANVPTYNPNDRSSMSAERARNRAVTDLFEPGSTMKPLFVSAALEAGIVNPKTRIDTGNGSFYLAGKPITDTHPKGILTVAQAIQVSSNVAMAKIAFDTPNEVYGVFLSKLRLGHKPASGLLGEASGRIAPYKHWSDVTKASMSYGMGMSVSLLQLARAYTVFANDGVIKPVTLRKNSEKESGEQIMRPGNARQVLAMLESVTAEEGTAPLARVAGYRVAGKTGTARKVENGHYAPHKYVGSFVGMAPASNPRVIVAVMIDEPRGLHYYGGLTAAPVFSRIMSGAMRFLAVPPDMPMEAPKPPRAPIVEEIA